MASRNCHTAACLCVLLLAGCSVSHQVDADKFRRLATGTCGTVVCSHYAGDDGQRAYVKQWNYSSLKKNGRWTTYWTPLSDLPPEVREELRRNPGRWPASQPATTPAGFEFKRGL